MTSVKWDIKDIRSEHSPYVDSLISDSKIISSRIDIMGEWVALRRVLAVCFCMRAYSYIYVRVFLKVHLCVCVCACVYACVFF